MNMVAGRVRIVLIRTFAMAVFWLVLTEGALAYPGLGILAVVAGVWTSLALIPRTGLRVSVGELLHFALYFMSRSILGGFDVARRALSPRMPLDPAYLEVELRLENEAARVVLVDVLSLVPGTLSVRLDGSRLTLHVLDQALPALEQLRELESAVARLFRLELSPRA